MGFGKNTKCIVLPHNGDPAGIIIPTIELIRFYYANSTRLSKAIFDGQFMHSPSSIYDPAYTGLDGKLAVVCRRQDVSDDDCWTIARIINSQAAFDGARRVSDSMMRDFANTKQANPESAFPFSGKTRIKALCKKVGYAPARWLVLSLVSCSAPFPYEDLLVMADNDSGQANPETDIPDQAKIPINRPGKDNDSKSGPFSLQSTKEPDKRMLPKRLELPGNSFEALRGKIIKKNAKTLCKYKTGQLTTIVATSPSTYGTADVGHSPTAVGKGELVQTRPDTLPPSYELLVELVQELNIRPNINARLPPLPDGPGLIKAKRTAPPNRRQWAYIDKERRQLRTFVVVEIEVFQEYFYLVEIERRPNAPGDEYSAQIFTSRHLTPLTTQQIGVIRDILSRQDGRIKNPTPLLLADLQIIPKRLRHTFSSTNEYATKLLSLIRSHSQ